MFACIWLIGACSGPRLLMAPGSAQALKGRTLTLSKRASPPFEMYTPSRGLRGAIYAALAGPAGIGIASAQSEIDDPGKQMAQEFGLVDPAAPVRSALADSLRTRLGVVVSNSHPVLKGEEVESAFIENGDVVLDVYTEVWRATVAPGTTSAKYMVVYRAHAKLVDVKAKRLIAEGVCHAPIPPEPEALPHFEELVADRGARLKEQLKEVGDSCVSELSRKMFAF